MKKRFFGALLLGALMVSSSSVFVSCKDYDDDIKDLQAQIDAQKKVLDQLQALIQQGSILKSVTPITGGVNIVVSKDGKDETFTITNGAKGEQGPQGPDGPQGPKGETGAAGKNGTVWSIGTDGMWYCDNGDGAKATEYRAVPLVDISKDGYWVINGQKTDKVAKGDKGDKGDPGSTGPEGPEGPQGPSQGGDNQGGGSSTANVDVKISDDGYWVINGQKTNNVAKGEKGDRGDRGLQGETGAKGADGKYYVPNGKGTFDIYQNGSKIEETAIKYWADGVVTATKSDEELKLFGVDGDYTNAVTISLNGTLSSLVFVPHLYLDGIEAIQYKWIGDTILKKYEYRYTLQNTPYRSHHRANQGQGIEKWKRVWNQLDDYLPNRLARIYTYDAQNDLPCNVIGRNNKSIEASSAYDATREWVYGPVWPVEYHLNPATSKVPFASSKPAFNVLEPDVIYYNTRATQSQLNITSPQKYEYYGKDVDVYGIQNGILTVGLKIEHPQYLAPWPTDETINPNGNTGAPTDGSTISYPAYPGDETYGHNEDGSNSSIYPGTVVTANGNRTKNEGNGNGANFDQLYANWYGFSKYIYNKDNKDNTIALQVTNEAGEGNIITSDYALIVPTRAQLEALVWNKKPHYAEPNIPGRDYGPQNREGDEEGWAVDEYTDCRNGDHARVHIYDSPEEALADPDGAALELDIDPNGLDLKPYLAVHMLVENLKKKEISPAVFNPWNYDIITVPYGEELKWGLHYEFELVEYSIDTNETSDSRYARFKDWTKSKTSTYNGKSYEIVDGWNASTDKSGVIIASNVTPNGETTFDCGSTVVDREPLVRVLLKNAKGDVLLDGYILLHINYLPDNIEITDIAMEDKKFDLCSPVTFGDNWSESSRIILTESSMMAKMAFDETYWADCMELDAAGLSTLDPASTQGAFVKDLKCIDPTCSSYGQVVGLSDTMYVNPRAYRVAMQGPARNVTHNEHGIYQLKIFNFGDIYGNDPQAAGYKSNGTAFAPAKAPVNGYAEYEASNEFEKKSLGDAEFWANGDGNTNFIFYWTLSEEEVEYLTHDKAEPIYVTRWFCFLNKDKVNNRAVYTYKEAPYVWVRMTMKITRDAKAYVYQYKNEDYWFHYQTGEESGYSGVFVDIQAPEYQYHQTIRDERWTKKLSDNLKTNKIDFADNDKSRWKYYFAPKEYQITALNGETYTITPRRGNGDNNWNQLFCKYVYPHKYANFGRANIDSYWLDPATITKASDAHTWDEAKLKDILAQCAIIYSNELDEQGNVVRDAGVFNDSILYAVRTADYALQAAYTPIAKILYQEQYDGNTQSYHDAGTVELIHWLKNTTNKNYAGRDYPIGGVESIDPDDLDNLVCYDVLNAIGYAMLPNDNEKLDTVCAYEYNHRHIGMNDWNKANAAAGTDNLPKNGYVNAGTENQKVELYAWLGVVRDNGCNVAQYVDQKQRDEEVTPTNATFKAAWERPINLKALYVDPAKDAKTNENIIYLIDYLKLFDWRGIKDERTPGVDAWGYMWKDHYWFWAYYNVRQIDIDLRKSRVMTNMDKKNRTADKEWVSLDQVTNTYFDDHLILRLVDENGSRLANTVYYYNDWSDWSKTAFNDWTYGHAMAYQQEASANTYIMNMMGLKKTTPNGTELSDAQLLKNKRRFGAIYYRNDTGNAEDFDLRIPITIWYEWGFLDYVVNLHVAFSAGQTPDF